MFRFVSINFVSFYFVPLRFVLFRFVPFCFGNLRFVSFRFVSRFISHVSFRVSFRIWCAVVSLHKSDFFSFFLLLSCKSLNQKNKSNMEDLFIPKDNEYDYTYQQLSNIRIESIKSIYSNTKTNFQPFTSEEMHIAIGHLNSG